MISHPEKKYRPTPPVSLPDRTWPNQTITRAPIWCSSDLRDGNQALIEPMDRARKRRMFDRWWRSASRKSRSAFPSASQTDFDFVRTLDRGAADPRRRDHPGADARARDELIARTFESLRGAPRAIVHFYNATSPLFRRVVFGKDTDGIIEIAASSARLVPRLRGRAAGHRLALRVLARRRSPATELDFAKEICDAVTDDLAADARAQGDHQPAGDRRDRDAERLRRPDRVDAPPPRAPRRDRAQPCTRTTIAAPAWPPPSSAVMAGADRVEGCLFGNGERTGNVDLVTLALNLYTQGVDPGLDFSDIDEIRRDVEICNQLPVHPRHPYAGDLVFTAFSGSHQDAIKKGFAAQQGQATIWDVPYLPIDPADLGRSYDAVIRVNSQSGKGGIAYLLATRLRAGAAAAPADRVRAHRSGGHRLVGQGDHRAEIHAIFRREYLNLDAPHRYVSHRADADTTGSAVNLVVDLESGAVRRRRAGRGANVVEAAVAVASAVAGTSFTVLDQQKHPVAQGDNGRRRTAGPAPAGVAVYIELRSDGGGAPIHGVGVAVDEETASIRAVLSAVNRVFAAQADSTRPRAAAVL